MMTFSRGLEFARLALRRVRKSAGVSISSPGDGEGPVLALDFSNCLQRSVGLERLRRTCVSIEFSSNISGRMIVLLVSDGTASHDASGFCRVKRQAEDSADGITDVDRL